MIWCPFCEQPQACSSSKEGFSAAALNYNTAYSHFKTCSQRKGRSAIDAFNDACARQPGGKAWAYGARGEGPRPPGPAPPRPPSSRGSSQPAAAAARHLRSAPRPAEPGRPQLVWGCA